MTKLTGIHHVTFNLEVQASNFQGDYGSALRTISVSVDNQTCSLQ